MNECNNWIVFVRGNHDNPAYFDGKAFMHKRFMAVIVIGPYRNVNGPCEQIHLFVNVSNAKYEQIKLKDELL